MSGAGLVGKGASPKVLIADALSLFAEALGVAIGLEPDIFVFPEHPVNGPVALEAVVRLKPDVALLLIFGCRIWMAQPLLQPLTPGFPSAK